MRAVLFASFLLGASVAGCEEHIAASAAPAEDAGGPLVVAPADAGPLPESAGWSISVVQTEESLTAGTSKPLEITVVRSEYDTTEVDLSIRGLEAGISATSTHVAANEETGTIVLSAVDDAPQALSRPTIEAHGSDGRVVRLLLDLTVRGAPGRLDTSAIGGVEAWGPGRSSDIALSAARLPDGMLLVAGHSSSGLRHRVVVARFDQRGDPDWNFGESGLASAPDDERWNSASVADVVALGGGDILLLLEGMHVVRFTRDGHLDTSFGAAGIATASFEAGDAFSGALAVQPDGRIVVVGRVQRAGVPSRVALARFLPSGVLDPTFGEGGRVTTAVADGAAGGAEDVALRLSEDGSLAGVVVAGTSRADMASVVLLAYLPSGALDPSFGTGGTTIVRPAGRSSAGSRLIVRGASTWVLCEPMSEAEPSAVVHLVDGVVDTTFVATSLELEPTRRARGLAIDETGRLLVSGEERLAQSGASARWFVERLLEDGTLDASFAADGIAHASLDGADDRVVTVLSNGDGSTTAVGTTLFRDNRDFAAIQLDANGAFVSKFGSAGIQRMDLGGGDDMFFAAVRQSDGSILATGASFSGEVWKTLIVRFDGPGNTGSRFHDDETPLTPTAAGPGTPRSTARAILTQPDKKIVVGSFGAENALARFFPDGTFDDAFGQRGIAGVGANVARAMALDDDGHILVAGSTSQGIAVLSRFGSSGAPDASFGTSGIATIDFGTGRQSLSSVAVDEVSHTVLFAGHRELPSGRAWLVGRVLSNGVPDASFAGDGRVVQSLGSDAVATALLVHPTGDILVAGTENGSGAPTFTLARYTSSGHLDATFGTSGLGRIALGAQPELSAVTLSPALEPIGVGTVGGPVPSVAVMRWKKNGTPDPTFGRYAGGTLESLGAVESHGHAVVMVGGERMVVVGATRDGFDQDALVARFWR